MFHKSNAVKQTYIRHLWLTVTVHDRHKTQTVKSHILLRCITVNVVPITAVSPRYSRRPHYRADLYSQALRTLKYLCTLSEKHKRVQHEIT